MGSLQRLTSAQSVSRIVSSSHGIGSNWLNRLKNQRDRLIASHWKARRCEPRASKRGVRRELGSLKNGQSRSSGKELSFISGEYAKSSKSCLHCLIIPNFLHYNQFYDDKFVLSQTRQPNWIDYFISHLQRAYLLFLIAHADWADVNNVFIFKATHSHRK